MRCTTASRTLRFMPVGVPIALGRTPSARRESAPRKGCVRSELVVHQTVRAHNRIALRLCVAAAVSVAALGCRNTAEPTASSASGSWAGEVRGISFNFPLSPSPGPACANLSGNCNGDPLPFLGHGTFANANAGLSFPVALYGGVATTLPRYVDLNFSEDPQQQGSYVAVFAGELTDRNTMTGRLTTFPPGGTVPPAAFAPFGFDTASITFHRVR
jgi:hypothetical protein